MKLEENVTSRREFDDTEMAIFGRFEGIESLKAQIVDVMDDMKMEASHGNVIVMGSENFGRKGLAIDIVKAIQTMDSTFSGKVAKISGEALNKKNIPMTLQKLRNGALIVENAGGLTPITVNAITESLQNEVDYILVVFEGEKETLAFVENYFSTVGVEFFTVNIRLDDKVIKLQIWDTCGQEIYRSLIANFYRNSSLAIVVYSITE